MPQLLESEKRIAAIVVSVVSTKSVNVNGVITLPSGFVINVKAGMHSLTFRTQAEGGRATITPSYET